MSETKMGREWPSEKGEGGTDFLRLKSGKLKVHVVTAMPAVFLSLYVENKTGEGPKGKSYNFPLGSQLPGYDLKKQYAMVVVVLEGEDKDKQKVLVCGVSLAKKLRSVSETWGGFEKCDVVIEKTGEKLLTKYDAQGVPTILKEIPAEALNLDSIIKFSTAEDLKGLPPASEIKKDRESSSQMGDSKATVAQFSLITDLCSKKEISFKELTKHLERKFKKDDLDKLNSAEASELIDFLKKF